MIREPLDSIPALGTLVHAGEAAIDRKGDGAKGIQEAVLKMSQTTHLTADSSLLSQLQKEAETIVLGLTFTDGKGTRKTPESYPKWLTRIQKEGGKFQTIAVEKRIFADVGPLVLAPQLDIAVEDEEGELWVVERKTKSSTGKDPSWFEKFRLDLQLLVQVHAAEVHFGKRVVGAMVRPIPYSRQNRREWTSDLPQPLSNVQRLDPLWIRRSAVTDALFVDLLAYVRKEHDRRLRENDATALGILSKSCLFCHYKRLCRGEIPMKNLIQVPKEEILLEEERRNPPPTPLPSGKRKVTSHKM